MIDAYTYRSRKALSSADMDKARSELDRGFVAKLDLSTLESEGHLSLPANSFSGATVETKTPRQLLLEVVNGAAGAASEPVLGLAAGLGGLLRVLSWL